MCELCFEASSDKDLDNVKVSETPIIHFTKEEVEEVEAKVAISKSKSDIKVNKKGWPAEMYVGSKKRPITF
jgi:hypothetical protein